MTSVEPLALTGDDGRGGRQRVPAAPADCRAPAEVQKVRRPPAQARRFGSIGFCDSRFHMDLLPRPQSRLSAANTLARLRRFAATARQARLRRGKPAHPPSRLRRYGGQAFAPAFAPASRRYRLWQDLRTLYHFSTLFIFLNGEPQEGLWELWDTRSLRVPRSGGRVLGVHGSGSFHSSAPREYAWLDLGHLVGSALLRPAP